MDRNRIEQLLREMGSTPVTDPDELTIARIEAQWKRQTTTVPYRPAERVRQFRRATMRRPAVVGAALLVAIAASVAIVVGVEGTNRSNEVIVGRAQDVTVELPSGEVVTPLPGEALPDGSIIETGASASGRIGVDIVSPSSRYVVRNGRLQLESGPASANSTTSVSSSAPTIVSTIKPSTADSSAATPTYASTTSMTLASTTTLRVTRAVPVRLGVTAVLVKGKVHITWSPFNGAGVERYVVIRVRSWNGKTLPRGRRIATINRARATTAVDKNPTPGIFYVVAVIGAKRTILAIGSVPAPGSARPTPSPARDSLP